MLPTTTSPSTLLPRDERDPFQEFDRISRDLTAWARQWRGPGVDGALMALGDLEETDEAFVLEVDLPGVRKGDVDVQLDGRRLVVTGERKERERVGILRRRTSHVGSYRHEVVLPADVDPDGVEASLSDGVLTVRLPKTASGTRRRITVH